MLQIKNTLGGGKPEGLYVWKKHEIGSELKEINESVSTLPYNFYEGCAVVLNEEIHILGGYGSNTSHYKWDGSVWTSVSTLPYNLYEGCAVVLNGEIHLLGSGASSSYYKYHYKWDGSSWTEVSTLPYNFYRGCAVVLGGELHILGSAGSNTSHYKWNGTEWTSVSTLPYEFYDGCAVIFDGEIHILGTYYTAHNARHYKWDGKSWSSVNTLPYSFYDGSAVVFDSGIHILSSSNNSSYYQKHYLVIGNVPVYTFLDYIVSDKETAYPDGGEKGGYWYERVVENDLSNMVKRATETIVFDNLTFASNVSSYEIGYSDVKAVMICQLSSEVSQYADAQTFGYIRQAEDNGSNIRVYSYYYNSSGTLYHNYSSNASLMNGSAINFGFKAGWTYKVIIWR